MVIKKILNRKPITLVVHIQTSGIQKIGIRIEDIIKPYSIYIDRVQTIRGKGKFYLRIPQSPQVAKITIYDKNRRGDNSFKAVFEEVPLKRKFTVNQITNPVTREFVKFAQWFSDKAGILDSNQTIYIADSGKFRIDYVNDIRDRKTGRILETPARINKGTGIIEIARNKFKTYTIPMRMAILLHEFSHFYLNRVMEDETEADMNALLIYLGLGYSRVEAIKVFLRVFYKTPSDGNVQRYKVIENMINNFEKTKMRLIGNRKSYNRNYYYDGEV